MDSMHKGRLGWELGVWKPKEQSRELVIFSLEKKPGNGNTVASFKYLGRQEKRGNVLCADLV